MESPRSGLTQVSVRPGQDRAGCPEHRLEGGSRPVAGRLIDGHPLDPLEHGCAVDEAVSDDLPDELVVSLAARDGLGDHQVVHFEAPSGEDKTDKARVPRKLTESMFSDPPVRSPRVARTGWTASTSVRADTWTLPAAGWVGLGKPRGAKGWRYADKARAFGPCKTAKLVPGRELKAACAGPGIAFTLDEAAQGELAVRFTPGTSGRRTCLVFGGTITKDVPAAPGKTGKFTAREAPAAPSCPLP